MTTVQQMNVKAGGEWRLIVHGPDGRDSHNRIIYREVVKPERLVDQHSPEKGSEPASFQTTVTFAEQGNQTKVGLTMLFPSAVARDYVVKTYAAVEGLSQTWARLDEKLATMSSPESADSPKPTARPPSDCAAIPSTRQRWNARRMPASAIP